MNPSLMREMMGKDATPASYFLLVKNGKSATAPQTKNTFPLTGHQFTVSSPELEAQMHETQKISYHGPNQTHNNFTVTHRLVLASHWNWTFLLLHCQCSYSNFWAFPWPLCNTGNVDLCSFDSRVKHFLHSAGSTATHAVLSVSPQLFQSEQKCLEEQGETHRLGGSMKTGSDG